MELNAKKCRHRPIEFEMATYFAIFIFIIIPGIILTEEVWCYGILLAILAKIGYWFAFNFNCHYNIGKVKQERLMLYGIFVIFFIIQAFSGFRDAASFTQETIDFFLNDESITKAKGTLDIASSLIAGLCIYSLLTNSSKFKLEAGVLIFFYGMLVSGASRSSLALYFFIGLLVFIEPKRKLTFILIIGISLILFTFLSYIRGDFSTSALGNPIFTAVGFPTINLQSLLDEGLNDEVILYLQQLAIKPFPNFLFQLFGNEKPILNFNVFLTELQTNKIISADRPISVYTAAAPLVYYQPIILTSLVIAFIYFIIGAFFISISSNKPYYYFIIISLVFLHRSNLLDIISMLISSIFSILLYKMTQNLLLKNSLPKGI